MRKHIQVTPKALQKLWNNWELRALVLFSHTLQLSLFPFQQRRYSVKPWVHIFLWFCYLVADSVATFTLGVMASKQGNPGCCEYDSNDSPDTFTAYAIQDNELWLRHLLGLVVQSVLALYIFLTSWKGSWLSFLTIPMLLSGFIKYTERKIYYSAVSPPEQFRNYGFEKAIILIETALGNAYDAFYTKTPLFYRAWGFIFRYITCFFTVFVLVFFLVKEWHKHQQMD
ncbi:hypothetical protein FCV25MIE_27720 [Fagus crenata]